MSLPTEGKLLRIFNGGRPPDHPRTRGSYVVQAGQILTVLLRKSPTTENTDETTRSARIAEPQIAAPERSVTAGSLRRRPATRPQRRPASDVERCPNVKPVGLMGFTFGHRID